MEGEEPTLEPVGPSSSTSGATATGGAVHQQQAIAPRVQPTTAATAYSDEDEEEDDAQSEGVAPKQGESWIEPDEEQLYQPDCAAPSSTDHGPAGEDELQALETAVASFSIQQSLGVPEESQRQAAAAVEDGDTSASWFRHDKHFFVLSSSGKPIYTYHGDENQLAGLMALISALVSVVSSQGDQVQHIRAGSTLIVFMLQGPLYFVAVSKVGESVLALHRQLQLLYGQMVLVVTTGLERIIQRNPSYDVRPLLEGVNLVLGALISGLMADPTYLVGGYRPMPVPAADRSLASDILTDVLKQSSGLYGLLMMGDRIIAMQRAKQQALLHPQDLLLLANFITSNNAYRHGHGEAFCPVCMPHYNPDAFLHAYIHYLDAASGLYLVLLAGSAETFHALSAARTSFEEQLGALGVLDRLKTLHHGSQQLNVLSIDNLPRPLGGRFGHTPLWHYTLKMHAMQQAISCPPGPLHRSADGARKLVAAYDKLQSLILNSATSSKGTGHALGGPPPPTLAAATVAAVALAATTGSGGAGGGGAAARPNKLVWAVDGGAALLGVVDREGEAYLVMDPLTDKVTALTLLETLRRHFADRGILADVTFPPS